MIPPSFGTKHGGCLRGNELFQLQEADMVKRKADWHTTFCYCRDHGGASELGYRAVSMDQAK